MNPINLQLNDDESIAFCLDLHIDTQTPSSRIDDILETATDKLFDIKSKCLSRNVHHIFFAGDLFNRIAVPHLGVNRLGEVFLDFKDSEINIYSILGNHDIVRNSLEAIDKSPTQTLFSFGVVTHLCSDIPVIINRNCMISSFDYTEAPRSAFSGAGYNILLAHMFYNASSFLADKHNLTKEDIDRLGYDMVILGHDHEAYPVVRQGKSYIYRFGSILRGTVHNYNFSRKPQFMVLSHPWSPNPEVDVEFVEIAHRPYSDVASEYVLNKKQLDSISGLQDVLSNLADMMVDSSDSVGDRVLDIINNDPNLPNDCRSLILRYLAESGE